MAIEVDPHRIGAMLLLRNVAKQECGLETITEDLVIPEEACAQIAQVVSKRTGCLVRCRPGVTFGQMADQVARQKWEKEKNQRIPPPPKPWTTEDAKALAIGLSMPLFLVLSWGLFFWWVL